MFNIKIALNDMISGDINNYFRQKGFKLKGKDEFVRQHGDFKQCLYIISDKIRGQEACNIQVNVAFRHDKLEKLTSELNGKVLSKTWPSTSICIGYLTEESKFIQWFLNEYTDLKELSRIIVNYIDKYAVPFWEKYSSISALIEGYENKDHGLTCIGNRYVWRMAAAYWLSGDIENARKTLERWTQGRPSEEEINQAIEKLVY